MAITKESSNALRELGFSFDPFAILEASKDPRLADYIVGHESFAIAWQQVPSLVFARAGGGKTTMRLYALQTNWIGSGGNRSFPISYVLPRYTRYASTNVLQGHLKGLLRAGATDLLVAASYHPELVLNALPSLQQEIVTFLGQELTEFTYHLGRLGATLSPVKFSQQFERAYVLPNPPPAERVAALCKVLNEWKHMAKGNQEIHSESLQARFESMVELLCKRLGFVSVFIYLDGVDSFPETDRNPLAAVEWIRPLLEIAPYWAARGIYLKGFLPAETEQIALDLVPHALAQFRRKQIEWTRTLLVQLLQSRVDAATEGKFYELAALGAPNVRNVEQTLVRELAEPLLPREALRLGQLVLEQLEARAGVGNLVLELADVERACARYRDEYAFIHPPAPGLAQPHLATPLVPA